MSTTQFIGKPVKQSFILDSSTYFSNGESKVAFIKNFDITYETNQDKIHLQKQLKMMREL
jgi:hypothetical protein